MLVIEVFDDSDHQMLMYFFITDHKCQTLSKAFFKSMVEVLLMLEIFLTEHSEVEDLLCGAPSGSKACLFFSDDLLRLLLQSLQYDLQHDFAWVTGGSVVLALLQVAFLGKCDD